MSRSLIKLTLSKLSAADLAGFAQTINSGFTAQVADYATPNPALSAFTNDINTLTAAITAWGVKGARGSHADHIALIAAADVVKDDLRMLADYAQNTMPDNPTSWGLVGFAIKRPKSRPVALEAVQNFRNFISRDIVAGSIKLKWKRPLDTDPGDVKGYVIQYANVGVQPQIDGHGIINILGIVPNTFLIVTPPFTGANYFWVTPFNSVGYGVSSEPVFYNAPGKV